MNDGLFSIAEAPEAPPGLPAGATRASKKYLWDRDPLDWYVEPEIVTRGLLSVERFPGGVWDPACGGGNIVRSCLRHGAFAVGTDIATRVDPKTPWWDGEIDFLAETTRRRPDGVNNIITNPPFGRAKTAEAFIRKALQIVPGKVAVFVDLKFLGSSRRGGGLHLELPPTRIWIVTPRPSCPPGAYLAAGNEANSGTADYCWMVWDRSHSMVPGSAMTGWLRTDTLEDQA